MPRDDPAHSRLIALLDALVAELTSIDASMADPSVLADPLRRRDLGIRRAAVAPLCAAYQRFRAAAGHADHWRSFLAAPSSDDPEYLAMARDELLRLERERDSTLAQLRADLATSEDRAVGSVILELRAGVGGDEAALWVRDLLDMYRRYAASRSWKVDDLGFSPGEAGGFRSVTLSITGPGVWSELAYEGGTHQVKRIPATETQGRVHTSTATVAVLPEPEEVQLVIKPDDVKVNVTTSQGPGGQNVNKVATAVHLIHVPTGIEVRMQESKSQHQNRAKAWKLLRARLYERERAEMARQRAQKRVAMIGTADRAEKIRTYRWKENLVVDHRLNENFNLSEILAGRMEPLIRALVEHDTARRLAAL